MERRLQNELGAVESALRSASLWRALTRWLLGAAGAVALILLTEALAGWTWKWLWLAALAAAVAGADVILGRNNRKEPGLRAVVAAIERDHPDARHLLAAAAEQEPNPASGEFGYMQLRVIAEVLEHPSRREWRRDLERKSRLALLQSLGAAAVFAAVLALLPLAAIRGRAALGLPMAEVTVSPGDTNVERGTSLVIAAQFDGEPPPEATLVVAGASGKTQRIALARRLADPVFGASLAEVSEPGKYHVEYRGRATRDYAITVFDYPALARADATLRYPGYTGLSNRTILDTLRVTAVEGSRLSYALQLNKPVAHAQLAGSNQTLSLDVGGGAVAALRDLPLTNSARYSLTLQDAEGRTNKFPIEFVFQVVVNKRPEVRVTFPNGDPRVSPLEEMQVRAEAVDDFGLVKYGIGYSVSGKEARIVELGESAPGGQKRQFSYLIPLENLGAQVDDVISYFAWADDLGPDGQPRRTRSDIFFAEVRPFEEIFRANQSADSGNGQQQGNRGLELAEMERQIAIATWKLQNGTATNFAADLSTVLQAQDGAITQAAQAQHETQGAAAGKALQTAVKYMERSRDSLREARKKTEALPDALAAQQAAYQALLKMVPREFRVGNSRNGRGGGQAGQPGDRQLQQLELASEQERYETERQATAPANSQQREQLQIADQLKQLAQRQQDLNERLKEMQTALQEARSEQEKQELQRQLKRLTEDEKQMLAQEDELRQQMEQSPNANSLSNARQQLDRACSDTQRAAQRLEDNAPSQALAAGARAQEGLQQLRQNLRSQTATQFSEQMRRMRNQARDLASQEQEVSSGLDSLSTPDNKTLDDSAPRRQLIQKMAREQSALTNLLAGVQEVTEQAETTEPLLSQQLYDTYRRANQARTDNLLDTSEQLLDHGLVSQAGEVDRSIRQNIDDLKQRVERAAESVLGSESDALKYAQKELDDLAGRLLSETAAAQTNGAAGGIAGQTNGPPGMRGQSASAQTASAQTGASTNGPPSQNAQQGELAQQLGAATENGGGQNGGPDSGPITGSDFLDWSGRMRDVEQVLDDPNLRNDLA